MMDVRVFIHPYFRQTCSDELVANLYTRFKAYKSGAVPGASLGRDASYNRPESVRQAGLWHIHVKDETSMDWHLKRVQFDKKSDTALIYCEGFYNKNYFLLLSLLKNAHETCRQDRFYLVKLAELAEKFRDKY